MFGQQRSTPDDAWPGDVIGLANAARCGPGTRCIAMCPCTFRPSPASPRVLLGGPRYRSEQHKQFRKGIEQLDQEGVVQVLRSDRRGERGPGVRGRRAHAVRGGPAPDGRPRSTPPIALESLPYQVARIVDPKDADFMNKQVVRGGADPLRRGDAGRCSLRRGGSQGFQREQHLEIKLRSLVAAAEG